MARITADSIDEPVAVVSPAATRQAELDALAAANKANAAKTIKALQDLGVGREPTVDPRAALAKLTSNQTLTDAEKRALGMSVTGTKVVTGDNPPKPEDSNIPDLNNRNKVPTTDPGAGFEWRWISMAYANNKYGGEWRKVAKTSGTQNDGTSGDGTTPPVGTPPAFVYNKATGKWEMPPKPTEKGSWVWDNIKGWVNTTVNPGATGDTTEGGPTLAINTFKNTLSLFFGASEMSQTWVDTLYKHVASFYNTGSTIDEALNLALQDVRNNPVMAPFTKRFSGIYALQDRLAKGEAITVPTIAEYFKTESAMGDVLRSVGLGELATQDFLGNVLGLGKSLTEVTNLIDKTFTAIDNAPAALKADLQTYFPGVDRTSLAKALLTGKEGWAELDRKVRGISVLSAAKTQGINVDLAQATNVADMGYDYAGALTGFQKVKELERGQMLGKISNIDLTQEDAIAATFQSNAKALSDIEKIKGIEAGRFSGTSGRLPSRMRGQGLF